MDSQPTDNGEAGILEAGNEVFRGGQSVDNASGLGNSDEVAALSHVYDPECRQCQEERLALSNLNDNSFAQPFLPWQFEHPSQGFYPFPPLTMSDDPFFQSLSDFEDVTYFNQPYLVHHEGQQEPAALELQGNQDEVVEPPQFQYVTNGEAFEPMAFDFNTLPHGPVQQPLLREAWMATHDSGVFESSQTPEQLIKSESAVQQESTLIPIALPQATETTVNSQHVQTLVHYEPPAQSQNPAPPVRRHAAIAPRRLLPSNGFRQRPVHRQPEVRARRAPVLQISSQAAAERAAKDRFLVQARLEGVSYKDIKRQGNFTEAESTLRGRFRTLTKDKKDRVRDPKWTEIDIHLLKEAVRVLGHGQHPDRAKISWMAVSSYIHSHGGSYTFGYSTCHRRWAYLESTGQLGDTGYDDSWEDYDDDDEVSLAGGEEEDEGEEGEMKVDDDEESDSESESESDSDSDDDNGVVIKTEK